MDLIHFGTKSSLCHSSKFAFLYSMYIFLTFAKIKIKFYSCIVSPPDDDFSPSNLQKITDDLSISLFDEIVVDILRDDRQRETNVHHRIEKKWLGSLTIPFSTLHERERVRHTYNGLGGLKINATIISVQYIYYIIYGK